MEKDSGKAEILKRAQRNATRFLCAAICLFVLSLMLKGPSPWIIELLRTVSEAAMVGGLADWFAVVALFRPVKLFGLISIFPSHTAVIPRNKERIAENLGNFVQMHFLKTRDLTALVRQKDPAQIVANWFSQQVNSENFGRHGANILLRAIREFDEESVQDLISDTVRDAIRRVDISGKLGELLEILISGGKHHELLDQAIESLTESLRSPETRANIAAKMAEFIREEYPVGQIVVPTEALGKFATRKIAEWIENYLEKISRQPGHEMRTVFDSKVKVLIFNLKDSKKFAAKGEEIKEYILGDERFASAVRSLWDGMRGGVEKDLHSENSEIRKKIAAVGNWVGTTLENDKELRFSFNRQVESFVEEFAPSFAAFASKHIEDEVNAWRTDDMSELIEQNIGADLQKIRINGTLIGGLLGGIIFAATYLSLIISSPSAPGPLSLVRDLSSIASEWRLLT